MKTKLYLIRHGETEWNKLGKFQGCVDIDLSQEGIKQAYYLSEKFGSNFDFIYSSPLKRALETANIIASNKGIRPVILEDIREINFGEWEGLTIKEIAKNYPDEFSIWQNDKLIAPICGGDLSLKNAVERSKNTIIPLIEKHNNKNILVVAHGGIIKATLIGLFNWDMTMYHKINLGNTSVCQINFNSNLKPSIVSINDTSHLPSDTV
ncbi:histidine phosphatase family protein, partial [Clostridium sp.]|uniref:histidine phosphatase family protein n=1 Tax=Clostridium sp. TaxID=1506 RepID=UPI002632E708